MVNPGADRPLHWAFLGRMGYPEAVALQERIRAEIRTQAGPDHLLLLEHSPVFTLGRSASAADVVFDESDRVRLGIGLEETDRGGRVTYHGPGQLVGYPIMDLKPDRRDVRRYVRDLQAVLVETLGRWGIAAYGGDGPETIGVWVEKRKIASIGVHLSRWVTTHGFALNVATDLSHFDGIVPCGLSGVVMTSMEAEIGSAPALREVGEVCARVFSRVFERSLVRAPEELRLPFG